MIKQRSLRANMIYNSIFQILTYAIPLTTMPYVARVLGVEHIGQYSYALSIVTYFTLVATLGSSTHGQRVVAFYRETPEKLNEVFWNTVFFRMISTIIGTGLYCIFVALTEKMTYLEIIMVLNIINVTIDINWFYHGVEDFKKTATRGLFVKLLGLIGVCTLVSNSDDTWIYAMILLGSTIIGNFFLWISIFNIVGKPKRVKPFQDIKDMILVFLPTVASQVYMVLDKSMIGWMTRSDYDNGCYDQAEKIVRVLLILISSISAVILPRVANLFAQQRMEDAKACVYKAYRLVFLIATPLFFGILVCSSVFVPVYLGSGYDLAIPLMQIFSWLLIVVSLASVTGLAYLVPTKQQNAYTISVTIAAIVNLIMNLILIPKMGAYGAAIASITAESIGIVIQLSYCVYKKQLTLKYIFSPSWKYYLSGLVMFIISEFLKLTINPNIIGLIVLIFVGILTYGILLLMMRDSFVLQQLDSIIHKLKAGSANGV